jgi:hypothetical protein
LLYPLAEKAKQWLIDTLEYRLMRDSSCRSKVHERRLGEILIKAAVGVP